MPHPLRVPQDVPTPIAALAGSERASDQWKRLTIVLSGQLLRIRNNGPLPNMMLTNIVD